MFVVCHGTRTDCPRPPRPQRGPRRPAERRPAAARPSAEDGGALQAGPMPSARTARRLTAQRRRRRGGPARSPRRRREHQLDAPRGRSASSGSTSARAQGRPREGAGRRLDRTPSPVSSSQSGTTSLALVHRRQVGQLGPRRDEGVAAGGDPARWPPRCSGALDARARPAHGPQGRGARRGRERLAAGVVVGCRWSDRAPAATAAHAPRRRGSRAGLRRRRVVAVAVQGRLQEGPVPAQVVPRPRA